MTSRYWTLSILHHKSTTQRNPFTHRAICSICIIISSEMFLLAFPLFCLHIALEKRFLLVSHKKFRQSGRLNRRFPRVKNNHWVIAWDEVKWKHENALASFGIVNIFACDITWWKSDGMRNNWMFMSQPTDTSLTSSFYSLRLRCLLHWNSSSLNFNSPFSLSVLIQIWIEFAWVCGFRCRFTHKEEPQWIRSHSNECESRRQQHAQKEENSTWEEGKAQEEAFHWPWNTFGFCLWAIKGDNGKDCGNRQFTSYSNSIVTYQLSK